MGHKRLIEHTIDDRGDDGEVILKRQGIEGKVVKIEVFNPMQFFEGGREQDVTTVVYVDWETLQEVIHEMAGERFPDDQDAYRG